MAASMEGVLSENLRGAIRRSSVLLVGAGGIGCELLKNLVLTGFTRIQVIDLDTIDVSNLNRQFLFRKEHVGKSKAQVAREGALLFNPDVEITAFHDSIMNPEYGVEFFKKFSVVMNALDNRAARNHVNRMCLAADVPLIESGTAGYLGQVNIIKKGLTECYECFPKPTQKTFPGCTIRNTPSEPIHCIVWAKHLFKCAVWLLCCSQLYGEADPDQDVSPDAEDPEAVGEAGKKALETKSDGAIESDIVRKSTRVWAEEIGYDPKKLFNKFFRDDVKYLLSMENLWKKRRPPSPVDFDELLSTAEPDNSSAPDGLIRDQRVWSMKECVDAFSESVAALKAELMTAEAGAMLVWDKDSELSLNFVVSTANIRSHIFNIPVKSKFDIKSMAGNIIPAIATTNAIIAGVVILEAVKVLTNQWDSCRSVYLNRQPTDRKKLLIPVVLDKPNPKCYVCAEKPQVTVGLNVNACTVKTLEDKIMKAGLGMVAPDVEIDDGKGTILISSEEGETEDNWTKFLSDFGLGTGSRLKCDDFLQEYNLIVNLVHKDKLEEEAEFEIVGDPSAGLQVESSVDAGSSGAADGAAASTSKEESDDDDLQLVEDDAVADEGISASVAKNSDESHRRKDVRRRSAKRKASSDDDDDSINTSAKKVRVDKKTASVADIDDDDDVVMID